MRRLIGEPLILLCMLFAAPFIWLMEKLSKWTYGSEEQ